MLLFSVQVVSDSLWCNGLEQASPLMQHHLPEVSQVHIHCIGDAIQEIHPCGNLLLLSLVFPMIGVFSVSWPFSSASARVLPKSIPSWFQEIYWFGLAIHVTLKVSSNITVQKHWWPTYHNCMWRTERGLTQQCWLYGLFLTEWCLFFHTLSRFVTAFLPRNVCF